ncbi:hypothetical protein TNCV_2170451 [Trichonephila clavipes]|nr:hypothetical protein TNCV_2170451 [Trichonephila clavipes]
MRRKMFSPIVRVTAEIRERFQQLQNLAQKYAFLRSEVMLGMDGEQPWGWSGASHLSSPSTNLTRGLSARRLFKVPPCREGTSISSLGFEPSPNGTAVSVANLYTGWATLVDVVCSGS